MQALDEAHKQTAALHGLMALYGDGGVGVCPETMERAAYVEAVVRATRAILDCDAAIDVVTESGRGDAAESYDMTECPVAGTSANTNTGDDWTCAALRAADEAITKVRKRKQAHEQAHANAMREQGEVVAHGQQQDEGATEMDDESDGHDEQDSD